MVTVEKMLEPDHHLIDTYCHFDAALKQHLMCLPFYLAKQSGQIVANHILKCWEVPFSLPRSMSYRARYFAESRGMFEDHTGDKYAWHDCMFCGGETIPVGDP